ncbi:hypothetical protein WN943_007541 [Citrus x changshan-huyou]
MHFESRKSILKEILDALSNRNFNMIGVYGMGGIGKTTLVKEVGRQAKENNLFEKVISSRVSQTPQIKEIQREIAEKLGLKIDEESETVRAWRLLEQLKKETKILIILDDIWGSLDLEAIGIPLADDNGGCKVLLTARSQDVLSCKMDCQHNFFVDVLNENEARSLFKKMTGDCIENGELKSVGAEIVEECAGLPIAIVPVAKALKNKSVYEWRNALRQLKRPFLRSFSGTQAVAAYSTIELSYNQLGGEELRKTFLLIGYSYICNVKDLLYHGMGLGLFPNINTVDEARDRAHTLVDKLKTSCLLLDGDTSEWFSMHDVVRDEEKEKENKKSAEANEKEKDAKDSGSSKFDYGGNTCNLQDRNIRGSSKNVRLLRRTDLRNLTALIAGLKAQWDLKVFDDEMKFVTIKVGEVRKQKCRDVNSLNEDMKGNRTIERNSHYGFISYL